MPDTKTVSVGERLPALLAERGVECVFGIPGVHNVEIYRGLPSSGIRHITPRHEQGAGFMADGYARASTKPGVCFVISGPGLTNILTAMGQAYADSIPMLVIATVIERARMGSGQGYLHELPDQCAMAAGVSAFARTVLAPEDLENALDDAFAILHTARPRPAYLEIPTDVLTAQIPNDPVLSYRAPLPEPAPQDQLDDAVVRLSKAESPVILAGGGARYANVTALAERLDAPVFMTANARGLLPKGHALGVSLSASFAAPRAVISNADVVLALGTELGETDYNFLFLDKELPTFSALIRIDIDALQCTRGYQPDLAIVAEANQCVEALLERLPTTAAMVERNGAARAIDANNGITELGDSEQACLSIVETIRDTLPTARIIGDSTQLSYAAHCAMAAMFPRQFWCSSTGFGTLGYALPAAVGASLADDALVVALIGDGGLQFTLSELSSAKEAGVRIILVVHDNQGYGEIRKFMQLNNIQPIGVDPLTPDLCEIARACGWFVIASDVKSLPSDLRKVSESEELSMVYLSGLGF